MRSPLSNMRWVGLISEDRGQDWKNLQDRIDHKLPEWGLELASEDVYLVFDRSPGPVFEGEGKCWVARSVIGPQKGLPSPFEQRDWVAAAVYLYPLKSLIWSAVFEEAFEFWQELQREGQLVNNSFLLRLKRRLKPQLELTLEVMFFE